MKSMTKREIVDQFHRLEAIERRATPDENKWRLIPEPHHGDYWDRWLMSGGAAWLESCRFAEFRRLAQTLREKEAA